MLNVVPDSAVREDCGVEAALAGPASSVIDQIVREGAQRMLAAALRAEVAAYCAQFADERDENGHRLVVRNGYHEPRSVTESGGLVWSTPKTHERRSVPFPAALADELSTLMLDKGRNDLVFNDMRGGVLRNSNWRARVFDPAVQACQKDDESFPTITPHDLRHTAASLAVSAGANVKALQRMLGHAKASMTLDVYADLFDEDLDSVAESLDAAIAKASSAAIAAVSGGSPAPPLLPQGNYDC